MSRKEERYELARIALDVLFPPSEGLPDDPMTWPASTFKTADAILAAGYRKSRTIESPRELDGLPFGSVVLDYYEVAWTCSRRRVDGTLSEWLCTEFSELVDSHYVLQHGRVTVLHSPEATP